MDDLGVPWGTHILGNLHICPNQKNSSSEMQGVLAGLAQPLLSTLHWPPRSTIQATIPHFCCYPLPAGFLRSTTSSHFHRLSFPGVPAKYGHKSEKKQFWSDRFPMVPGHPLTKLLSPRLFESRPHSWCTSQRSSYDNSPRHWDPPT